MQAQIHLIVYILYKIQNYIFTTKFIFATKLYCSIATNIFVSIAAKLFNNLFLNPTYLLSVCEGNL